MKSLRLLPLLMLLFGSQVVTAPLPTASPYAVQPVSYHQSSSPYVTIFKIQASSTDPSPFVLYPSDSKTAWVIGTKYNPFLSQLINFSVGTPPKAVFNTTASLDSVVVDRHGKVWFAGDGLGLGYYDPATGMVQNVTAFQGEYSLFITIDSADRVWLTLENKVAMYDPLTKQNTSYPVPTPGATLQGITVAPDGMVWFAEAGAKKLARLDPSTSSISEYSSPLRLVAPIQVAVDNTGVVWFTDHGTNEFGSFNPKTGEWRKFPIGYCPGTACLLGLPNAMFVDRNDKIWFSEHLPGRIAKYDPESSVLTEYIIPTPSGTPTDAYGYAWWASPGPDNLVWFTAIGYGEIGYINSSIPVPFTISTSEEINVQKGLSTQLTVTIDHPIEGIVSLGVSNGVEYFNRNQFISGSSVENIPVGNSPIQATIGISAAWNAPEAPRTVMITASDGQVAVSIPVRVNIIEPVLLYAGIALAAGTAIATTIVYFRRRHKRPQGLALTQGPEAPPEGAPPSESPMNGKE